MAALEFKDTCFLEAFDRAASRTLYNLGESARVAILYHMQELLGKQASDFMKDPFQFMKALEEIFSVGSSLLEDHIITSMCTDLKIPPVRVAGSFDQKLELVYSSFIEKKGNNGSFVS